MINANTCSDNNQVKSDYTKTPNYILEYCAKASLTSRQYSILLCVIRKTFGFHKKTDWISSSQIKDYCNYKGATTHINSDLRKLINRRILIKKGSDIGFNTNCENWQLDKKKSNELSVTENGSSDKTEKPNVTENGSLRRPKTVTTKETNTKEKLLLRNSKEIALKKTEPSNVYDFKKSSAIQPKPTEKPPTKKNNRKPASASTQIDFSELPECIPLETAKAFVEHRRAINKPLTQYAFKLNMKVALKAFEWDLTPDDVINETIASSWQAVKWGLNALIREKKQYMQYTGINNAGYQTTNQKLSTVDEANRAADEYCRQQGIQYST